MANIAGIPVYKEIGATPAPAPRRYARRPGLTPIFCATVRVC
mgnify:CR=1 FL=1